MAEGGDAKVEGNCWAGGGPCGRCRKVGAVAALVVALGVLLPVGIWSWHAVIDVLPELFGAVAPVNHEKNGDAAFNDRDYARALVAYGRARALRNTPHLEAKEARARLYLLSVHPELIAPKNIEEIEYDESCFVDQSGIANPTRPTFLAIDGHIAALRGDTGGALKQYFEALAQDKDNPGAHLGAAIQYLRKGDRSRAKEEFASVVASIPTHVDALIGLGDAMVGEGESEKAVETYSRVLNIRDDARAHHGLGLAYLGMKKAQEAAQEFQKSIAANPQAFDSYVALATMLSSSNILPQAERTYRGALALRAQDESAITGLANVLNRMGRPAEALQAVMPLIQARSAGPGAILEAARSSEALGRKDDAKALYSEVGRALDQLGDRVDRSAAGALTAEALAGLKRLAAEPATETK